MTDPTVRFVVVVVVALVSVGAAWWARGRASRSAERRPIDVSGFGGRVLLFTSSECPSCAVARAVLKASGTGFVEITHAEHGDGMRQAGITAVPIIVVRDAAGSQIGVIAGKPSHNRLRRLLERAGL